MFLIAFTAEELAAWEGADRDKTSYGLFWAGGTQL